LAGADLVLPGGAVTPDAIARQIVGERVSIACADPVFWHGLLRHADDHRPDLSSLRMAAAVGGAVPRSLVHAWEERHGVPLVQVWGTAEMPLGAVAHPPPDARGDDYWEYRGLAGRLLPFVEARLVNDLGDVLPWDGETNGELQVRGPWVERCSFDEEIDDRRSMDGWLTTGDVASISHDGWLKITERTTRDMAG
jgi:fatty-acyl-CoA synthase